MAEIEGAHYHHGDGNGNMQIKENGVDEQGQCRPKHVIAEEGPAVGRGNNDEMADKLRVGGLQADSQSAQDVGVRRAELADGQHGEHNVDKDTECVCKLNQFVVIRMIVGRGAHDSIQRVVRDEVPLKEKHHKVCVVHGVLRVICREGGGREGG